MPLSSASSSKELREELEAGIQLEKVFAGKDGSFNYYHDNRQLWNVGGEWTIWTSKFRKLCSFFLFSSLLTYQQH